MSEHKITFILSPSEQKTAETTSEVVSDIGGIPVKFNLGG
jgi:hypothetical protein